MFRIRLRIGMFPAFVCRGLSKIDCSRAAAVVLRAFGSAATACLYCSPYHAFPEDFVWKPEKTSDEETHEGDALP